MESLKMYKYTSYNTIDYVITLGNNEQALLK